MKRFLNLAFTAIIFLHLGICQLNAQNPISHKDSLIHLLGTKSADYDTLFKVFIAKNKVLITEIELLGDAIAKAEEQETKATALPYTAIKVDQDMYHFGRIKDGQVIAHIFTIRNIGLYPLIIKDTRTTCGCTVPEWPKDPIEPGKSAEIKVTFNSEGKGLPGGLEMVKKVTIIANTEPFETYLSMRGFVIK